MDLTVVIIAIVSAVNAREIHNFVSNVIHPKNLKIMTVKIIALLDFMKIIVVKIA